jgi:acyl-coenzyme A thioesterase PaaI-like protein
MSSSRALSAQIRSTWERLSALPMGKWLFSQGIGRMAPYSGTVGALVDELRPGYARVLLRDRKKVRNHLNSVHAIALMNLGELATGLALMSAMPDDARGILAGLSMDYHKKARGLLTAECSCEVPESSERKEYEIVGEIKDESGELVATARARWLIGPRS